MWIWGCLPKGKRLQDVENPRGVKSRLSGRGSAQTARASRGRRPSPPVPPAAPRVRGGIPEVAFPARPRTSHGGKSRGRGAPAAPSLGFPKGELGLNNGSI